MSDLYDLNDIDNSFLCKRVFQGRFENDYAGFQQYAIGIAATVAKVRSFLPE